MKSKPEMFVLTVTVDTNDADYKTKNSKISKTELDKILPLIKEIKKFTPYKTQDGRLSWNHSHNYPTGQCCREDLGEKNVYQLYPNFSKELHDTFQ